MDINVNGFVFSTYGCPVKLLNNIEGIASYSIDTNSGSIATGDGSWVTSQWKRREISFRALINAKCCEDKEEILADFHKKIPIRQLLPMTLTTSIGTVTTTNVRLIDVEGVVDSPTYQEFDLTFIAPDPYFYDVQITSLLDTTGTLGLEEYTVRFGGTTDQLPTITYTLDSVTDGDNKTITIGNPSGFSISVLRDWTSGEILVIDSKNKIITVDDEQVDFTGNFPAWSWGEGQIDYEDDFSDRQYTINAEYTKRYS